LLNNDKEIEKMRILSEKEFGAIFHMKESLKFNYLYLIFKYICIWCPILIFLLYIVPSIWIIPSIILIELVSWICSIKMRSLFNINLYASKILKEEYLEETFR